MSKAQPLADRPPTLADLWEILRLPMLLALGAVAVSWLVWYFTSASCTMELAQVTGCNPSRVAQYINLDALNKIAAHGVVAGSGGGVWSYAMITRERRAREDQAKQFAEERERNAEERERNAEERRLADERLLEERQRSDDRLLEERRRFDEQLAEERRLAEERLAEERRLSAEAQQAIMRLLTEERAQSAEERAQDRAQAAEERAQAAEERAQSAEERRQFMAHIENLTQRIADQQNGDSGPTSQ